MDLNLQKKLIENPKLYNHLKQNSNWIKILNRNPNAFKDFEAAMKEMYKERATDKMDEILDNIDLITTFLNAMK